MSQRLGQILQKTRRQKGLSLDQVALELRIRQKFLQALESEDFSLFASEVALVGFLKNYTEFLKLPLESILALYRRDHGGKIVPAGLATYPASVFPAFSPEKSALAVGFLAFLLFVFYLLFQYWSFNKPPRLTVWQPLTDGKTAALIVDVAGQTEGAAQVFINDQEIDVGADGRFSQKVPLRQGANTLTILARAASGKENSVVRQIVVEP